MDKFFKDTLDEVIATGHYATAKKMLKMHETFQEYDVYMEKIEKLLKEEKK